MGSFDKRNENFLEALSRFSSLILLFAFYGFVFLLTEITVNIRAAELWGEGSVLGVYAVGLVCTGCGYLAYTLAQRCLLTEKYRKLMLFIISFMAMVGVSVLLYTSGKLAIPAGCLALLAMGFLAAAIYYYMSCALANSPATGRIIGISMFLAVLLQYGIMHSSWKGNGMVLLVLGLAVAGICLLIWRPLGDWCFENALPYEQNPPSLPREGLLAALMVFFMTMGFAFSDECVTALDAKGELNVAAWPRLFYGLGLLLSGYLVDLNRRSHIYIITSVQAFAKAHELTPREEEVLQLILTKDGTTKELAKELMISERVCQRYLTSIYDKTGTNSKVGLILLYYGGEKK